METYWNTGNPCSDKMSASLPNYVDLHSFDLNQYLKCEQATPPAVMLHSQSFCDTEKRSVMYILSVNELGWLMSSEICSIEWTCLDELVTTEHCELNKAVIEFRVVGSLSQNRPFAKTKARCDSDRYWHQTQIATLENHRRQNKAHVAVPLHGTWKGHWWCLWKISGMRGRCSTTGIGTGVVLVPTHLPSVSVSGAAESLL